MNWLDGLLIAVLILGAILGLRHRNFIGRLSHFLAVFSVLAFTTAIFWAVLWIVDKIPFLNVVANFLIGIGGPIIMAVIIGLMLYLILVKLYRDKSVYEIIQSTIRWNSPDLVNRLGTGLATSGIIAVILAIIIIEVTLFAIGGFYGHPSFSGPNWHTITAIFGSALCRSSLQLFTWLCNWTGLVISIILVIGYSLLLRRGHLISNSIQGTSLQESNLNHRTSLREYYENKLKSVPGSSVSPETNPTATSTTEATMAKPAEIPPLPPLPRTSDASAAQECFGRACDLETLGKHEKAIEEYTKAIRLDAKHTLAYLKRGLLLKNMGMKPAAIADFKRVLDTSDNPELIEKAKGHIAELG